jgi:hypothetical protein
MVSARDRPTRRPGTTRRGASNAAAPAPRSSRTRAARSRSSSAFVASGEQPSLAVHSLRDGAERRRTATPLGSYNVQQAAGRVLTPSLDHGTLTVLDPEARVVRQVRVAPAAHDACVVR